jgi:hypothetical protein
MATELAHRVARRRVREAAIVFRDVHPERLGVEYSNSGRISAVALARMLEPQLGVLVKLRFRPAITGTPNTIAWEALDENANVISGKLVLHAGVTDDEVISWAEVTVDEDRDARAARRVAVRYMRDSGGLVRVDDDEESEERVGDEGSESDPRRSRRPRARSG